VEQCLFTQAQFTPTHPISFFKTTALKMAEQCLFMLTQFTPTHPIAFLKITML
jgi:hypothetical protein